MTNKRFFSTILLLFFAVGSVYSQNSIRHSVAYSGKNAIVRQMNNNVAIAYSQEENQGYFLYDNYGVEFRYATMLPNCRVYDFEIYNDTVFFCGKYDNAGDVKGIFGFFDINEVFFNSGYISGIYCNYSISAPSLASYDLRPTIPWRMDVFSKGCTHIAAVGACYQKGILPDPIESTAVYDVYYDGSTWHCEAFSHKSYEYYTDIVATEHYIVAVAKDESYDKCYIRLFNKISGFLSSPVSNQLIDVVDDTPIGKVIVDALEVDTFAVSNFYFNSTEAGVGVKRFAVTSTSPYVSLVNSIHIPLNTLPSVSSTWNLRDIRYNNNQRKLALLLDMDYPVHSILKSTVLEIDNPYIIVASWTGASTLYALDQWSNGFHSIGYEPVSSSHIMTLFRKSFGNNSHCSEIYTPVPYYENTSSVVLKTESPAGIVVEPEKYNFFHLPQTGKAHISIDCE